MNKPKKNTGSARIKLTQARIKPSTSRTQIKNFKNMSRTPSHRPPRQPSPPLPTSSDVNEEESGLQGGRPPGEKWDPAVAARTRKWRRRRRASTGREARRGGERGEKCER
uniref:Uncharacterized protein n=1 Tax=Oryza rufipogon TaxID=4529 RepID=A0A0E0QB41_ORYRU